MPASLDPVEERILRRIPWEVLAAAAVLGLGAAILFGLPAALCLLAGGLLSSGSFLWTKRGLDRALHHKKRRAMGLGLAFFGARLVLILLIFFIIILTYSKGVLAFTAGFSLMIPVFLAEAVWALSRARSWKD